MALAASVAAVLSPAGVLAQSLLASGGLGLPVEALDARARALGGVGVGLMGGQISAADPTAAVDLLLPTITFSSLSSWVDASEGGAEGSFSGTRFPSMGIAYPAPGVGVVSLTFGGVLDQRWTVERQRIVQLDGGAFQATDRFLSEGGVASASLGFARRIAPSLGLGISVGALTGEVTRTFTRAFDTLTADVPVDDFEAAGRWDYSGVTVSGGAVLDVADLVRAAAVVTWNSTLDAEPSGGTEGAGRAYDLPLEVRLGVTGVLAPGLAANVGAAWADWEAAGEDLEEPNSAGRSLALGGGVEWSEASILGRDAALRLGYRFAQLPFAYGLGDAEEGAVTGGLGVVLAAAGEVPIAAIDLSLEWGERMSDALEEKLWRVGLTLRVSGL